MENDNNTQEIPGDFTAPEQTTTVEQAPAETPEPQPPQQPAEEKRSFSDAKPSNSDRRESFRKTVNDFAVSMYTYVTTLKGNGHSTVAENIFKQAIKVVVCTNAASSALTHDRFVALLEEAYYASVFLTEYMHFAESVGCDAVMHEPLMEMISRIQKGLAASVKTSRGKKQAVKGGF